MGNATHIEVSHDAPGWPASKKQANKGVIRPFHRIVVEMSGLPLVVSISLRQELES